MIAGAITAQAASLDVRQKSSLFSTDQTAAPVVIKPVETKARLKTTSRWKRVKVQKINPIAQSPGQVEVSGFVFNKPAEVPSSSVTHMPVSPEKK